MTIVSHIFPKIHLKVTSNPKNRKKIQGKGFDLDQGRAKARPRKYDSYSMLMDRISGMKWKEISEKYRVPNDTYGLIARNLAMNSAASNRLSPKQVEKLFDLGDLK